VSNAATSHTTRYIATWINRSPEDVYRFTCDPRNLTAWASGLAGSVEKVGDEWVASSAIGRVRVRFAEQNALGVLDHDVTLETGQSVHNPMRVMPHAGGSEVVFVLFRRPGVTDAELEADAATVSRDLQALKRLLEAMVLT
jgi:hypothetical protein